MKFFLEAWLEEAVVYLSFICKNGKRKNEFVSNQDRIDRFVGIYLSMHENVNMQMVLDHPDIKWSFEHLSGNSNITIDDILNNSNTGWDISYFCQENPNATVEFAIDFVNRFPETEEDVFSGLSCNSFLKLNVVLENIDRPWNWVQLSDSLNITISDVLNNLYLPWVWKELAQNKSISIDDVLTNPTLPWECIWDYESLSNERKRYDNLDKLRWDKYDDNFVKRSIFLLEETKVCFMTTMLYFKNNVIEELMAYVWHPARIYIWKNLTDEVDL